MNKLREQDKELIIEMREMDGDEKTTADSYYMQFITLIRNATLDGVEALTFKEPEYISNSQEHRRGYNKALDNMNIAINNLRGDSDESGACGWHGGAEFFNSDTNYYDTDCGHSFVVNEGSPSDNNMNYCCYCGKKIQECV